MAAAWTHQWHRAATALAAVECLAEMNFLTWQPNAIRSGLLQARWPGRMEVSAGEPTWVLDGAHNPNGVAVRSVQ